MIFGVWYPEKIWHENLTHCPPCLSDVALYLGKSNKVFSTILFIHFWLFTLSHKKTICNRLAYLTRKCHHTNLWIAKLFHLTESLLRSLRRWRLWKEPVVGCRRELWKEPVVMCGNWNVKQAMSQQVFRVTTFCVNTCFQSFSTLISCTVHHVVLKFSRRRNKLLSEASTCPYQYTHSPVACPRHSTGAM